jgi:hypothetical protein
MTSLKDLTEKIKDYFNPQSNAGNNFWGSDNPLLRGLVKTQQLVNPYQGNTIANKIVTSKPFQAVGQVQNNIEDFWNNKRDLTREVDFLSDEVGRSKVSKPLKIAANVGLGGLRTGAITLNAGKDVTKGGLKVGGGAMFLNKAKTDYDRKFALNQIKEGGLEMGGGLLQGAYAQFRNTPVGLVTTAAENALFETIGNIRQGKPISEFDFRGAAKDMFLSDALGIRESHPLAGLALDLVTNLALGKGEQRVWDAMNNPRHRQAIMRALQSGDKKALVKAFKNLEVYVKDFGKYAESAAKDQRGFANLNADINLKDIRGGPANTPEEVGKLKVKPQAPQVPSKAQIPELGQTPLKGATQVPQMQPQGQVLPKQSLRPVETSSYGASVPQTSLKGTKTLFGNEPIETGAKSVELDVAGKAKLERRAKLDAERAAKDDYNRWYRAQRESGQIKTTGEQLDVIGKNIEGSTRGGASKNIEELKDIGNIAKGFNTLKRNFKSVFGKRYTQVDRDVLEPFSRSKDLLTKEMDSWAKSLESLKIPKGSKLSGLVQMFGEKKISYEGLKSQVGEVNAKRVVEADKFFRQAYNTILDEVNAARAKIYPNNPEKIIPKRSDYYRHFQQMQEGVAGLKNIFENPAGIQSTLAGISGDVKPKSRWLPFAQKRTGDKTTYDAVGGFIEYVQKAMYAKHIDPNIERFRSLATDLEQATLEGPSKGKLNNFIEYLHDFASDLSGKTGPIDRIVQKYIPGGRKAMRTLSWLNNRVKANVILMNLSSSLAQLFNIPQGVANAGIGNSTKGLTRTLASIFTPNKPMQQSRFIRERYADPFSGFDVKFLDEAKKGAKWIITVGDEIGTKFIWNAHYEKALKEGIPNPIKFADDATESMVAGRGIGEVPLMQKDKVFQLLAPFQLEVGNLWWVMKGWVGEKAFGKIATFAVGSYLMNRVVEEIRGSDVSFDPINAVVEGIDAYNKEEDKKMGALKLTGRVGGEVLSNVPGGQTVAALYPEYGATVGDTKLPTRKDLFGKGDPTRFGGGLLVAKGLQDPLYKIVPPFGGQQIKRTMEGVGAVYEGESKTKGGDMQYPIEQNARNYLQAGAFGKYAVPEGRAYFEQNRRPLSEKQSTVVRQAGDKQSSYDDIMSTRKANATEDKARETVRASGEATKSGDKYLYYDKETGEVKSINLNSSIEPPKLTGEAALDKEMLSDYKSSISRRINDVVKLYELGQMTSEQAEEEIDRLTALKRKPTTKKAKRVAVPKISLKTTKLGALKLSSPKSPVLRFKKLPKAKIRKPKLSFKAKKYAFKKVGGFKNTLSDTLTRLG